MNIAYDLDKYMGAFNFRLSVDGIPDNCTKIVSINSVTSESEIVEYMLGPEPYIRKIPGRGKFTEVEITRIYQGYDMFYNWRQMIEDGIDSLRNARIEILAPDLSTVVLQMVLHNCWPSRWQLPNLDASSTGAATETITLCAERLTQSVSNALVINSVREQLNSALPGVTGGRGAQLTVNTAATNEGPLARTTASGLTQEFAETGAAASGYTENDQWRVDAASLAGQLQDGPLDPNAEDWEPPTPGDGVNRFGGEDFEVNTADDPTAARNGGDGEGATGGREDQAEADYGESDGVQANTTASGDEQEFFETGGGEGPIGGRGDQEGADFGEAAGVIDPSSLDESESEGADDPTADYNGRDGDGVKANTTASGEKQEFFETGGGEGPIGGRGDQEEADYGETDGINVVREDFTETESGIPTEWATSLGDGPIDPSSLDESDSEGADDPTADYNGRDGDGPKGGRGWQDEAEYGEGSGPIGGRGAQEAADGGEGSGPIDPSSLDESGSAAADDPTAGRNGGDGSGPIGGRGAQEAADGGAGSGPIDAGSTDDSASAAADDPTAARNGGGGSGPVGGRGAQEAADYGSPGDGPKGGRGEGPGGDT
ncbi:MAG: phage tail protein [Myxococcota bacterium]